MGERGRIEHGDCLFTLVVLQALSTFSLLPKTID